MEGGRESSNAGGGREGWTMGIQIASWRRMAGRTNG